MLEHRNLGDKLKVNYAIKVIYWLRNFWSEFIHGERRTRKFRTSKNHTHKLNAKQMVTNQWNLFDKVNC